MQGGVPAYAADMRARAKARAEPIALAAMRKPLRRTTPRTHGEVATVAKQPMALSSARLQRHALAAPSNHGPLPRPRSLLAGRARPRPQRGLHRSGHLRSRNAAHPRARVDLL